MAHNISQLSFFKLSRSVRVKHDDNEGEVEALNVQGAWKLWALPVQQSAFSTTAPWVKCIECGTADYTEKVAKAARMNCSRMSWEWNLCFIFRFRCSLSRLNDGHGIESAELKCCTFHATASSISHSNTGPLSCVHLIKLENCYVSPRRSSHAFWSMK